MSAFCLVLRSSEWVTVKKRNFCRNVPKVAFYSMDDKGQSRTNSLVFTGLPCFSFECGF
jgi:hypothetical protein